MAKKFSPRQIARLASREQDRAARREDNAYRNSGNRNRNRNTDDYDYGSHFDDFYA